MLWPRPMGLSCGPAHPESGRGRGGGKGRVWARGSETGCAARPASQLARGRTQLPGKEHGEQSSGVTALLRRDRCQAALRPAAVPPPPGHQADAPARRQASNCCSLPGEPQPCTHSRCSRRDRQAGSRDVAGNGRLTALAVAPRTAWLEVERLPTSTWPPLSSPNARHSGTSRAEAWPRAYASVDWVTPWAQPPLRLHRTSWVHSDVRLRSC